MPWIDEPEPCGHPGRPELTTADVGHLWECGVCHQYWKATLVDYGHDVMPGERAYDLVWELQ